MQTKDPHFGVQKSLTITFCSSSLFHLRICVGCTPNSLAICPCVFGFLLLLTQPWIWIVEWQVSFDLAKADRSYAANAGCFGLYVHYSSRIYFGCSFICWQMPSDCHTLLSLNSLHCAIVSVNRLVCQPLSKLTKSPDWRTKLRNCNLTRFRAEFCWFAPQKRANFRHSIHILLDPQCWRFAKWENLRPNLRSVSPSAKSLRLKSIAFTSTSLQ